MSLGSQQRYYLKLKAAHYYYEKDYTQIQIAKMLGVSRITLGKLLREAKEEGMVKVEIVDVRDVRALLDLEVRLQERFGLVDAKVVDCLEYARGEGLRKLAMAGARYMERAMRSGMKLGLAWGRTQELLVDCIQENRNITDLEVITLVGGSALSSINAQPNFIAQRLLEKYSGTGYILNAPFLCQTEELCRALYREPQIAEVLNRAKTADLTLIGIGETPRSLEDYGKSYNYTEEILGELKSAGAVGDICANFYDINGKICKTSVSRRIVAIDIEDLRKHKKVVAVGGGPNKWASVVGALRGGYLNVLITDKFTAEKVLDFTE